MLLMTLLALAIDCCEIDSVFEPILQDALELCQSDLITERRTLVMTLRTIVGESCVICRNFSRTEEGFVSALLKDD
jgi:hypothetical protein